MSLSRSSLFIHAGLLLFLPDFLFVEMHCSWAGRRWSWILTSFLGPLFPPGLYPMVLYRAGPCRGQSLTSRVVSLLCALLAALRDRNSTISWSLQPRLPLCFTFPTSPFLVVRTKSSLAPLLMGRDIRWDSPNRCSAEFLYPAGPWCYMTISEYANLFLWVIFSYVLENSEVS